MSAIDRDATAAERSSRDVETELAECAGVLNVAHAHLVEVMAHVLDPGASQGYGMLNPAQWLAWRTGVSMEVARKVVRVAKKRASFPICVGAFDRGELSFDQLAEVVRAPAWADARVLDFARCATVAQLRRTMREEYFEGDPAEQPAPTPENTPGDRLSCGVTEEHRWRISGEFDLDTGRRIETAITQKQQALFEAGDTNASLADGLVALADAATDALPSQHQRDRSRTHFHFDVSSGVMTDASGWRIPMAIADHLCCDGIIQPVWEQDGVPVSVGMSQRIVPDRTRRLVMLRDRGCRVPGCTHDRFVEVHHIVAWQDGGPTDTWNLICICPKHHRLHHQGLLGITGNADAELGVTFTDFKGRVLGPCGQPIPPTGPLPRPPARYEHPEGTRLNRDWVGLGWVHPTALERRRQQALRLNPSTARAA